LNRSSLCELYNDFVDRQLGDRLLQPGVFCLPFLQALGLVDLQPAAGLAPAGLGLLGHPDLLAGLGEQDIDLAELADDLLRRIPFLRHVPVSFLP
jgi:hypothetical protein